VSFARHLVPSGPKDDSDEPVAYDNMTLRVISVEIRSVCAPTRSPRDGLVSKHIRAAMRSKKVSATLVEESSRVSEFWDGRFLMEQLREGR